MPFAQKKEHETVYEEIVDGNVVTRRFAHNPYALEAAPPAAAAGSSAGAGRNSAKKTCWHFTQGRCNRGTACRFAHPGEGVTVLVRTPNRTPKTTPKLSHMAGPTQSPGGVSDDAFDLVPSMALPPATAPAAMAAAMAMAAAAAMAAPPPLWRNNPYAAGSTPQSRPRPSPEPEPMPELW